MKPFSVVIPSRSESNLAACLDSIFQMEPTLDSSRILVVDDGIHPRFRPHYPVRWLEGKKPFVFARAANQGIEAAGTDVILMNDDSRLLTPGGFSNLARHRPAEFGLVSAAIREHVGNLQQKPGRTGGIRQLVGAMAFICVLIPLDVYQKVGPFDEQFTAYGSEDNDYCIRVAQAGLKSGTYDPCLVAHDGQSTFRSMGNNRSMLEEGRRLLRQKWNLP